MNKTPLIIIGSLLLYLILLFSHPLPLPKIFRDFKTHRSVKIYDRNGELLRQPLSAQGGRRSWMKLGEVSPEFLNLLIQTEDRRFAYHPGVDPLAFMRASFHWVKSGKIVSGASTITMQLARMMLSAKGREGGRERNIENKIWQGLWALYLEMALSKQEILEITINHLPFGNELYGLLEASHSYFRKNPKDLSLSESAYLLGMIRAPSFYNPYKKPQEVLQLRDRILNGYLKKNPEARAKVEAALKLDLPVYPLVRRFRAGHFTTYVIARSSPRRTTWQSPDTIMTSLDLELNERVEEIVGLQLASLAGKNVHQGSVLVVSNKTGEILAYVGSADFWDDRYQGMIDGILQKRQPGSALKPFTYARALDMGLSPSHVLADVKKVYPSEVGDYIPENYDRQYRGPVLLRTALANSLNVPAVQLLQEIGVIQLYQVLQQLKFSGLVENPAHYGLGLTLGNVEVSLFELVRAYSVFARGGRFCELTFLKQELGKGEGGSEIGRERTSEGVVQCSRFFGGLGFESVVMVRDFLSDRYARRLAFGVDGPLDFDYAVMIKTGTSQNFRDNWTVAVTPEYTVGVWVGNFNGDPMEHVSGVTGAAPIAHQVVDYLYQRQAWSAWQDTAKLKKVRVCSLSGKMPTSHCPHTKWEFAGDRTDLETCDFHITLPLHTRDNLLASASCPPHSVSQKTFVRLPLNYLDWQQENWPESLPPHQYSQDCPDKTGQSLKFHRDEFKILSPENNVVYQIDLHRPKEAQYLSLKTTHPHVNFDIYLDEKKISKEQARQIMLVPGRHYLKLVGAKGILDEISYRVK